MNSANVLKHFGLVKPYDFRVAIPFLLGLFLIAFLFLVLLALITLDKIHWATNRSFFVVYLFSILFSSILFCRKQTLYWILIGLFSIEVGLAALTALGAKFGLMANLLPQDGSSARRFKYHSLLQGTPIPNWQSTSGLSIRHNSMGLRGPEITRQAVANKRLIFLYGGSTTYDVGVTDGKTWQHQLQSRLGENFVVANFGVPGYSTVENLIQTAFYQKLFDRRPNCAIYYVGWNDIRNAYLPNLDPAFADYHLLAQLNNLQIRQPPISEITPLLKIAYNSIQPIFNPAPLPPDLTSLSPKSGSNERLEGIFKDNIELIATVNRSRGIKPIFIGQILNRSRLVSDGAYGWLPLVRDKDVWSLQEHFNSILQTKSKELGAHYISVDVKKFANSDFVDNGHFSEQGAARFSSLIKQDIFDICSK